MMAHYKTKPTEGILYLVIFLLTISVISLVIIIIDDYSCRMKTINYHYLCETYGQCE
jgi:hypothetical protein